MNKSLWELSLKLTIWLKMTANFYCQIWLSSQWLVICKHKTDYLQVICCQMSKIYICVSCRGWLSIYIISNILMLLFLWVVSLLHITIWISCILRFCCRLVTWRYMWYRLGKWPSLNIAMDDIPPLVNLKILYKHMLFLLLLWQLSLEFTDKIASEIAGIQQTLCFWWDIKTGIRLRI